MSYGEQNATLMSKVVVRKSTDFLVGGIWGLLFFFIPSLVSGLYGFPLYDLVFSSTQFSQSSVIGTLIFLTALYITLSTPVFIIYVLIFRKRGSNTIGLIGLLQSFGMFVIGFLISMFIYFTFGLVGFSGGEFGL